MSEHPELRLLSEAEELPSWRRLELLRHLRGCAACRAALAAREPSRLFALLALQAPPAAQLDRLSRRVAEAISEPPAGRLAGLRGFGFASLAASLVLAGVVGSYLWMHEPVGSAPALPVEPARVEAVPSVESEPSMMIELLSSPGTAQVLDLSVGETQLIMIFDEALDI